MSTSRLLPLGRDIEQMRLLHWQGQEEGALPFTGTGVSGGGDTEYHNSLG